MTDVWLQLLARCTRSWDCRREAMDQLASVMTAQRTGTPALHVLLFIAIASCPRLLFAFAGVATEAASITV
jgi:hypothetical protein